MQTIDFLPDRFRNATTRRRTSYWRVVVAALFLGAFGATAFALQAEHRAARREHEQAALGVAAAKARTDLVTRRLAERSELDERAALAMLLRHPWPRSRIVAAVFDPLPPSSTMEKIHLHHVSRAVPSSGESGESATSTEEKEPPRSALADVETLRREAESHEVVVTIEGTTSDVPGLHRYLEAIADDTLFLQAELASIDAVGPSEPVGQSLSNEPVQRLSRFTAQIVVRPGWGLAEGPSIENVPDTTAPQAADVAEIAP